MKMKVIQNWKTTSKEEMFLYILQNRRLHFYYVDKAEVIQFCRFCIDNGLLEFRKQKEYRGTPAEFNVLRDFNIQWMPTRLHNYHDHPVYTMSKGDGFVITELLKEVVKLNSKNWCVEADVPTGENRLKYYEWARKTLCP